MCMYGRAGKERKCHLNPERVHYGLWPGRMANINTHTDVCMYIGTGIVYSGGLIQFKCEHKNNAK